MKTHTNKAGPAALGSWSLMARWRKHSLQHGWRVRGDWLVPEVEPVAKALMGNTPLAGPSRRLGAARSYHGVGIAETMADFSVAFSVGGLPVDTDALQKLVIGWVECNERVQTSSCTDVMTGLATPAHFERVVHDACLAVQDQRANQILGTIIFPHLNGRSPADWTLLAELGQICAESFPRGAVPHTYQHGAVHFLMQNTPSNLAAALDCQSRLDGLRDGVMGPSDLRYCSLPATADESSAAISQLRRRQTQDFN